MDFNPCKIEWLWVSGASDEKVLSSLVLDGMALIQMNLVCNLGVLLDSRLLLEKHGAAIARKAFAYIQVVHRALLMNTHILMNSCLDYCNSFFLGQSLKSIKKL